MTAFPPESVRELSPREAWQSFPLEKWTPEHARHLFRRASWAARPEDIERSAKIGPAATVREFFQQTPTFPISARLAEVEAEQKTLYQRTRAAPDPETRREIQREARQNALSAFQDMNMRWLDLAATPAHSPYEKWVTFLQDVFVVSFDSVRNPALIYRHHDLLRQNATGSYRDLCRAVSRSPAMIRYLDLQVSKRTAPNENFARELFELFMLGEGNYTENDIKEAARAFTGYRDRQGKFFHIKSEQDLTPKTVFGRTGQWNGDDIIRLALEEKAGSTFLPTELCRFYLSDQNLPPEYIEELGKFWRENDFNLGALLQRFFTSRIFYAAEFRGNLIKSPLHFHLGLLQDLQLDVPPFPRQTLAAYRQMGQQLFHPPNVRGWVGGRLWINSSTVSARRQLVERLFQPINEEDLNADEQAILRQTRENGRDPQMFVTRARLAQMADADPETVAARFIDYFLPLDPGPDYRKTLIAFLKKGPAENKLARIRTAVTAILQSPEYNLC